MKVNCDTPITIFNPLLNELVALHKNIHINGLERKFINSKNLYYAFNSSKILPSPDSVPVACLDNYYISNSVTGETYPIYIQVPCGHCEVCKNAKVNAFVDRCKLETQLYNSKPIFITLTYDDIHRKQEGVSVRDIQLFLKRMRINLYRRGYREKFDTRLSPSMAGALPDRITTAYCGICTRRIFSAISRFERSLKKLVLWLRHVPTC